MLSKEDLKSVIYSLFRLQYYIKDDLLRNEDVYGEELKDKLNDYLADVETQIDKIVDCIARIEVLGENNVKTSTN